MTTYQLFLNYIFESCLTIGWVECVIWLFVKFWSWANWLINFFFWWSCDSLPWLIKSKLLMPEIKCKLCNLAIVIILEQAFDDSNTFKMLRGWWLTYYRTWKKWGVCTLTHFSNFYDTLITKSWFFKHYNEQNKRKKWPNCKSIVKGGETKSNKRFYSYAIAMGLHLFKNKYRMS